LIEVRSQVARIMRKALRIPIQIIQKSGPNAGGTQAFMRPVKSCRRAVLAAVGGVEQVRCIAAHLRQMNASSITLFEMGGTSVSHSYSGQAEAWLGHP
jgi:hypothetical protein